MYACAVHVHVPHNQRFIALYYYKLERLECNAHACAQEREERERSAKRAKEEEESEKLARELQREHNNSEEERARANMGTAAMEHDEHVAQRMQEEEDRNARLEQERRQTILEQDAKVAQILQANYESEADSSSDEISSHSGDACWLCAAQASTNQPWACDKCKTSFCAACRIVESCRECNSQICQACALVGDCDNCRFVTGTEKHKETA